MAKRSVSSGGDSAQPGRAQPGSSRTAPTRADLTRPGPAGSGPDPVLSVPVRVRPGAGRNRVGGAYAGPHGPALIVAVGAAPVDGHATEAVRRALADALGIHQRDVTLRLGATSRDKVYTVPRSAETAARLAALRDGPR